MRNIFRIIKQNLKNKKLQPILIHGALNDLALILFNIYYLVQRHLALRQGLHFETADCAIDPLP